jgi:arylsulfatase A-like enzyme/Flp pilus assembly protein TadD
MSRLPWSFVSVRIAAVAGLTLVSCARGPDSGSLAGWNVLLITVDTLRADRLGFAGYEPAETPILDAFAGDGVVFENAISSAPVTLPSHASLMTGRYPPGHGALDNAYYSLPDDVPTLATVLRTAGYETAAIVGAYVLHGQFGLDAGFDRYDDFFRQPRPDEWEPRERRAGEVSARAGEWLAGRKNDRPFFLWVHMFDPHSPYDPPPPFNSRFAARPYDGEIAYTDRAIGTLLESLDGAGFGDRTMVVVTADHGEGFGDGGEKTHGLLLRTSTLRVPLLLRAPGVLPAGRRVEGLVSTVDLMPTVLDLLGVDTPTGVDGSSIAGAIRTGRAEGRRAYSETRLPANIFGWSMLAGSRNDRWAWVRGPIPELYDLDSDPGQTRSLHAERPEKASDLDRDVERVLGASRGGTTARALSSEEVDALRALGYAYGSEAPKPSGADPKERLPLWNRFDGLRDVFEAGRYAEAAIGLEELLNEDPGNYEARTLLGRALVRAGRVEEGLREFQALLEAGRARGRTGAIFAHALTDAGHPEEAETLLRVLCRSEPEDVDHPFNLGVLLLKQGRWKEARAAYEEAHRLGPEAIHVLAHLSISLSVGADPDSARAVDLIDRAVELAREDDRPLLAKAKVLSNVGRTEDARSLLRELAARRTLHGVTKKEVAKVMREIG